MGGATGRSRWSWSLPGAGSGTLTRVGVFDDYMAEVNARGGGHAPDSAGAGPKGLPGVFDQYAAEHGGRMTTKDGEPVAGVGSLRQWYTGANLEGTGNGWDTGFQKVFQEQVDRSLEAGKPYEFFKQADATGVVTWDNAEGRNGKTWEFGDVIVEGRKVGNVYDDFEDRHVANVMMGEYLIQTGARKAELNESGDPVKAWEAELEELRTQANRQAEVAPRAAAFQEAVETEVRDDPDREGIAAGGAAGGAVLGGGIGTLIAPGAGTAIGALLGGVIGGVGAWLNSDSLAYQVARSQEQLKYAEKEGAGIQAMLSMGAQTTMSVGLSPLQNLYQGTYDWVQDGGVGEGALGGAFQEVDPLTGERKAGAAAQLADFAFMIGDSALQFASPAGRLAYQAQMTTQISAGLYGMVPGVGQWDQERIQQTNVWMREEWDPEAKEFVEVFDAGNAAAGIGSVAIDAVQLGAMSSLSRGVDALAGQVARQTGQAASRAAKPTGGGWAGGLNFLKAERLNLSKEQRAAVKAGTAQVETRSGYKFVVSDTGEIIGRQKGTLAMLAPSEGLQALTARMLARRDKEISKGAVSAEQLYNTASDLAMGQRGLTAMLTNAVGEAQEEAIQGLLEPWSMDHAVDVEQVFRAAAAGAASGFGMTAGARMGRPNQDMQMFAAAMVGYAAQHNGAQLTYDRWQKMDALQKRTAVKAAQGMAKALTDGAFDKIARDRVASLTGGVVEAQVYEDWVRDMVEADAKHGAMSTDQASPIVMHESSTFRPDAVTTSHTQLLVNQQDRTIGARAQLERVEKQLKEAGVTEEGTAEAARVEELTARRDELRMVVGASQVLERTLQDRVAEISAAYDEGNRALASRLIRDLNGFMGRMFDMSDNEFDLVMKGKDGNWSLRSAKLKDDWLLAYSKAVGRQTTRDPNDSSGSLQILLPQVDEVWAWRKADGLYGVSQVILKAIRGDFDGDKTRMLEQLVFDTQSFKNIRSGANVLGVEVMPEIGTTKYEKHLSQLVRMAWRTDNGVITSAAHKIAEDISNGLRDRYHNPSEGRTPIKARVLDEVDRKVLETLSTGGDIRKTVLEAMSGGAGNELTQIGQGDYWREGSPRLSNELYWIADLVTRSMNSFQSVWAEYTPGIGKIVPQGEATAASQATADTRKTRARRGATEASNIINELAGSNLFRMFTKLHYNLWETTEKFVGFPEDARNSDYVRLVEFYEALSQGVAVQRLERENHQDVIIRQTMEWLEQMAADPVTAREHGLTQLGDMALLANVQVDQVQYVNVDGVKRMKFTGKQVSMAQHLLYLSLDKFRSGVNSQVWEQDEDMRAAYNSLIDLTSPPTQRKTGSSTAMAEIAFVTLFENVRAYEVLGSSAASLGVNRTIGQIWRRLVSMDPNDRKQEMYALRDGEYGDAEGTMTIPFTGQDLSRNSVTTYRSVVDSLFSAANGTIRRQVSGKDKGEVSGRWASQSNERARVFRDAWRATRTVVERLEPRTGYTPEQIRDLVDSRRDLGLAIMQTIPKETMGYVVRGFDANDNPIFAEWIYSVYAAATAEEAEMIFWRNWIMDSWNAMVRMQDFDFANGVDGSKKKGIEYHSLKSRMHRAMFRLASNHVGGLDSVEYEQFLTKLNEAQSVEQFMKWVNSQDALVGDGAPLLAWMDEVSMFDPDRAGGGYGVAQSTPIVMENIRNLKKTAERLIGELDAEDKRSEADIEFAEKVERWLYHLDNPDDTGAVVDKKDEQAYNQYVQLLKDSATRRLAAGPRAMLQHTSHLVYGIYAPAHAKAQIPEQLEAQAALESFDNAFGYVTTPERIAGDLTAHNEDAVAQAPQMVLRDGGRMMDRYGSQVEWEMNAVRAMLPLALEKKHHNLHRSMVFDTVLELDTDNVPRRKFLMGSTLEQVAAKNTVGELFPKTDKAPALTEAMKWLVKLEQELRDDQKNLVQQKVTEHVLVMTTALDHTASFEEIQAMTVQAYLTMADITMTMGRTKARPDEPDPVHEAFAVLEQEAHEEAIAKAYGIDVEMVRDQNISWQAMLKADKVDLYSKRIDQLLKDAAKAEDPDKQLELTEKAEREKAVMNDALKRIDQMFDFNINSEIFNAWYYTDKGTSPEWRHERETKLMEYVWSHGEFIQQAGDATPTVILIKNYMGERKQDQKVEPLDLSPEKWEELANVIISVEIQNVLSIGPASGVAPPYPKALEEGDTGLDKQKYWDHSFSFRFDFMSPKDKSGILEAARKLAKEGGQLQQQVTTPQMIEKVQGTLLKEGNSGVWSREIPIQAIESWELLQGASAKPSVSMHGLLSRRWGATMKATERQLTDTVADATVVLSGFDLDWTESNLFHDVTVTDGNGRPKQRPLALLNNRFAEELDFTYVPPGGTRTQAINLIGIQNAARTWIPAKSEEPGAAARFKEVNLVRLREELELMIKRQQPDADATQVEAMLDSVQVRMKFVDPDAQPASEDHANSLWHEGTVYQSDGDVGKSLITAFFFGIGGINARGQQAALDTRKLGLFGIEDYRRPTHEEVLEMEKGWGVDFAGMVAKKTSKLMDTAISNGKPIDPHFFNAAYKLMKLKHWVEGTDRATDKRVRWSAEEVTAWQRENPGVDIGGPAGPLADAELWLPSDQVLADMMGDVGFGGVVGRALKREVTTDISKIPRYRSTWTDEMERKFGVDRSQPKQLMDTDVARAAYVKDITVSSFVTPQERTKFQRRVERMQYDRARASEQRDRDVQNRSKRFNPRKNQKKNLEVLYDLVSMSDTSVPMPPGFDFLEMSHGDYLLSTVQKAHEYIAAQQQKVSRRCFP